MRAIVGQLDAGGKVFRPDDMAFLGPNELNQMHEQIRQQVVGIGAILKLDPDSGEVVVTSPMPDSPALKGGLEPGDIIASVDGMDLPDAKRLEAAVKQLRGPAGTAVTVGVRRSGSEEVKSVKLVRDVVRLPSVKGDRLKPDLTWDFMLDYQSKIGYVRLTQLGNRSPDEMRAALEELRSLGLAALILDLRNNPGGTLADAVAVADLFVQSGTIVTVKGRSGTQEFAATAEETFAGFPMAVLVNHRTASAAEIVAACLQDHKRAVIIGERTYGQALVRSMIPLEGGAGALKLPTAEYLRPSGRNVNRYPDARDSDEWERLELTLDLFDALSTDFRIGLAVQAYQKRALAVCEWLASLQRPINVRLVKGAYWDGEVKRAQQLGMPDYPVFTRKAATDLSYVACARVLLRAPTIYPAFATHNCRTVATILELANDDEFEFQKLFGMGDALYDAVLAEHPHVACRIYAPVGGFTDLLPYLVRRLLENGANTSFVHQIADPRVPLETLVADPLQALPVPYQPDPRIPLPRDLYPDRRNSLGLDLSDREVLDQLQRQTAASPPLTPVEDTSPQELDFSIARAASAFESWSQASAEQRAQLIERAADRLEAHLGELVSLIVREGGRAGRSRVRYTTASRHR
jgi:C-terminal peptidase prc